MLSEGAHRLGRRVAHGDQSVARQHEADRRRSRLALLDPVKNTDRHVERAVTLIEAARRLDLRHLAFGRDVEMNAALDQRLFLRSRLLEIDPGCGVRNLVGFRLDNAPVAGGSVGAQHRRRSSPLRPIFARLAPLLSLAPMSRRTWFLALAILTAVAAVELAMGRNGICICGTVAL